MSNNILSQPVFIISLALESAWGYILFQQHKVLNWLKSDPQRAREAVGLLLGLFERYSIPATWATVGHLFLSPGQEKELVSREMPQFNEGWLDWDFYTSLNSNPLYYGQDIIDRILASPVKHEIGLHSFFHIPFSRCSRQVAEVEVQLGIKAAQKFGINPKSFVFPGDEVGHTETLKNRFLIYRGTNAGRYQPTQGFLVRKANGAIAKVIASPVLPSWDDGIWQILSSTPFYDHQLPFTLLPRARLGLFRAMRTNKIFHITLHPHDLFYQRPAKDLEKFLALVARQRERGKLEVMTMGALADYLSERNRVSS